MHFTGQYWTALTSTKEECFKLLGLNLHCTTLHCRGEIWYARHCTAMGCNAMYCTVIHGTALFCTVMHCAALHCTALWPCMIHSVLVLLLASVERFGVSRMRDFSHQKWSSTLVDLLKLLPSMCHTDGAFSIYLSWEEKTKWDMFYLIPYIKLIILLYKL